jgi:serine/threonine-protein kinase RsbW
LKERQDHFEITAQPQSAALAREHVKQIAAGLGFTRRDLDDIEVAVGDAATNAILYGSPSETSRIVITSWFNPAEGVFQVEVHDQGRGFDSNAIRMDQDTDALGGRGIRLMRALMDRVKLHYDGSGMSVCLTKRLPAA